MLTTEQQSFIQSLEALDIETTQSLLQQGLDPNFIDPENGPPISIVCDGIFQWWEVVCEAYENEKPLSDTEKQTLLQPHLTLLDLLIDAKANLHLWDTDEFYGPLWDAASAACVPAIERLLAQQVDPNTKDDDDLTILSSISHLFFECDYDEIDWSQALPEEKNTLDMLREHGAKMSKELI
ncbi:ankyrin repeat domain-containing protein [Acinetobacter pollinis]|uniref:ankyrin repeat domain-containing protein n=1 Tax=Acinetobacter pollinis TaxID=2605270 RepID=UPI0018A32CFD|nr:ankyrin repeat domain-containing protein [Acinetobacter pollinis]MBF7690641.1 ankyrin repeat domain-containing protein [Acinetobacter pollinis]MBF7693344.1 ankyrin repeat domain-containing protein [Acinetobacter pollinis]MBF7698176.1 ankyrin repeat domain-containing protein [Acinetobacter pollinis]MBF7701207.1 ankyrin repeat domain-containing protein [Acinetobacter pollinis]